MKNVADLGGGLNLRPPGIQSDSASYSEMELGKAFFMNRANTEGGMLIQ